MSAKPRAMPSDAAVLRRVLRGWLAAATLLVLLSAGRAWGQDYTIIALPDTQNYSSDYPDIYHSQTQYCVDSQAALNTLFVTHLGDVVNNAGNLWEWDNARPAMDRLDLGGMPYGVCVGNHDIHYPGDYYDPDGVNFRAYFGPAYHQGQPWFGGASPSELSSYQVVDVGGRELLILHLLVETPAAELAWAQGVLSANRDKPTLVSTHRYLFDWVVLQGRYGDEQYLFEGSYRHDGIKADDFFHNFVAVNRQIFMVYCGHCAGEHRQTSDNIFGYPVYEVLADYQDGYGSGGNGWLRQLRFDESAGEIHHQTYSPWLDDWRTGNESDFTSAVNLDDYVAVRPTLHFQQGYAGYTGAQDTCIKEAHGGTSYGNDDIVVVDDDTENSWFNDYEGQGLFRFDGLVQGPVYEGDPEPTAIPAGATVHAAVMTINLDNDTNLGNPEFYVYRMLVPWDESTTWDSLSGGVDPGVDCEANWMAMFHGDNDPNYDYNRSFSVLPAVQAWVSGETNHGVAILPERLDFNDDGIDIHSSEWGTQTVRPALDVEFSYTVLNTPPTVTAPLSATPMVVNEGETVRLSVTAVDPNPLDPLVFTVNGLDIGYATGGATIDYDMFVEDEGVFTYTATVTDDEVTVPAGSAVVTAYNVDPSLIYLTGDLTAYAGQAFDFEAEASDPGVWDVLTYLWDLDDDGEFDDHAGPTGQWSFVTPGLRLVHVRVLDDDGGSTTGQFSVDVLAPIPGDADLDGDVDLDDYLSMPACMTGPDQGPIATGCDVFDFDGDLDVDLTDVDGFWLSFTGSL